MGYVLPPKAIGQENFDTFAENLIGGISEQNGHLAIREPDDTTIVNDDDGIRGRVEHTPGEGGRNLDQCSPRLGKRHAHFSSAIVWHS
jgi:hypothetical protein